MIKKQRIYSLEKSPQSGGRGGGVNYTPGDVRGVMENDPKRGAHGKTCV